uniref:Uncharacterized protein n=1 Tax=Heliothis virescens TaxID=7102 RepID=A0A2A4IWM5_HELVI
MKMASKVSSWSTKEEVLDDIRRAAGRRIGKKEEIESCLIIGDVPPPVLEEDVKMASKVSSWSTKEEVLDDIRRAAGRRIGKKEEIESCLIIGDVPPPVLEEDGNIT